MPAPTTGSTTRMSVTGSSRSSTTSSAWLATTPANGSSSCEASRRASTSCSTAVRRGPMTMTTRGSTSSASTRTARSWSTGTCCSWFPPNLPTTTACSDHVQEPVVVGDNVVRVIRRSVPLAAALVAAVACTGTHGTSGRPLHAPANFDPSLAGFVACSRLIVEGDVVMVSTVGTRMITELAVDDWIKPASGPKVAHIETADIAAEGVYEHWKQGKHLFLQVDA